MFSPRVAARLAACGLALSTPLSSPAFAQKSQLTEDGSRRVNDWVGKVGDWSFVRSVQKPSYCWMMGHYNEKIWGISVDNKSQYGLVFFDGGNPIESMPVKFRMLNQPFSEEGKSYESRFKYAGVFGNRQTAYHAFITNNQLAEIMAHKYVQFTALYPSSNKDSPPLQVVAIVSPTGFTKEANAMLDRCEASLKG